MSLFKKSILKSGIAAFTLVVYLATQTGLSEASENLPKAPPAVSLSGMTFSIPESLGNIEEMIPGSAAGKTLIYIQDAHDSLEAQEHIAQIIRQLVKENGIKTVFEEGYEGAVPTEKFFGFIKDPVLKQKVSHFFLDKLRIGGAEYAHINRPNQGRRSKVEGRIKKTGFLPPSTLYPRPSDDFRLIGVERSDIYRDNLAWYKKNARLREDTNADLNEILFELQNLSRQWFPESVKNWLKTKEIFEKNQITLFDYLTRVASSFTAEELTQYPEIIKILALQKQSQGGKQEIDSKKLFEEIEKLDVYFADAYLRDEKSKILFEYLTDVRLLMRLNELQAVPAEIETARERLKRINTDLIAEFIFQHSKKTIVLSRAWESSIQNALSFYSAAQSRDEIAVNNIRQYWGGEEKAAVLVFGGFHKAGLRERLVKEGYSLAIISPRITREDSKHKKYYKELMSAGHLNFELPLQIPRALKAEPIFSAERGLDEIEAVSRTFQAYPDAIERVFLEQVALNLHPQANSEVRTNPSLEERLSASAYIHQVHIVNRPQHGPVVLIVPDFKALSAFAESKRLYIVRDIDLLNHPEIHDLLWNVIEKVNLNLEAGRKIQRAGILRVPFNAESGEIVDSKQNAVAIEKKREGIINELYRGSDKNSKIIVEAFGQAKADKITEAMLQTKLEPAESGYFESEEFGLEISDLQFPGLALAEWMLKILRQDFRWGRSEHYQRLLRLQNGEAMYERMEKYFKSRPDFKIFRIMHKGRVAGRIVFNEKTKTLVDGIIFAPYRGSYLGDVLVNLLHDQYGPFTGIIPSEVPIYHFFVKRGFKTSESEKVGSVILNLMTYGDVSEENLKAAKGLLSLESSIYADAMLDDFALKNKTPEESALYRTFPELYDLLYQRFSKRLIDFLDLVKENTPSGGSILDAAAGTGEVSVPLLQAGYSVLSADLNPGMLEQLEKKARSRQLTPKTLSAGFLDLAQKPGTFDTVTVRQAINYLIGYENLVRGLKSFRKRLGPGGKLVFNAPNYQPEKFSPPMQGPYRVKAGTVNAIVRERNSIENHVLTHHQEAMVWDDSAPSNVRYYHDVNTFELYTKDQIEQALKEAGFSDIQFFSSQRKPYDANDPVIYAVATVSPKIVLVAGTFDEKGGASSSLISQIHEALPPGTAVFNGGNFSEIPKLVKSLADYDVILWFPNVSNEMAKYRNIKDRYPDKVVITSKRNHKNQYSLLEVVEHALKLRSSLVVEFSDTVPYTMRLIDPLGNTYENTQSPATLAKAIMQRLETMMRASRQNTELAGKEMPVTVPENSEFFQLVQEKAAEFHALMQTRVQQPGQETCFRCERGFPSIREGNYVFVSKRNAADSERYFAREHFVPVDLRHFQETGQIRYYGTNKPSVDTPIQMRLYSHFAKVKYILHSHEYIAGAPTTQKIYAAEALEEFDEILKTIGPDPETANAVVNLAGHGSVVLASDLDYLKSVKYIPRPFIQNKTAINGILIGGVFDNNNGIASDFAAQLQSVFPAGSVQLRNGGSSAELQSLLNDLAGYEVIFWAAETPEQGDLAAEIKKRYPFKTFIPIFDNRAAGASFQELINKALGIRSNLFIEIYGNEKVRMRLFDPLANQYADTDNVKVLSQKILERLETLRKFTRQSTSSVGPAIPVPVNDMFRKYLEIVQRYGMQFHDLIHPAEGVNRYLGNTSFRASHLFSDPEYRNLVFISQRNIDKRNIDENGFVAVQQDSFQDQRIRYYGTAKPSVDTPTQVRFFNALPNVHFILHSHVYIEGAPFTSELIPCGSLEEVEEVLSLIHHDSSKSNFAINLLGHGSIIFAKDLEYLAQNIQYSARPIPEFLDTGGHPARSEVRKGDMAAEAKQIDSRPDKLKTALQEKTEHPGLRWQDYRDAFTRKFLSHTQLFDLRTTFFFFIAGQVLFLLYILVPQDNLLGSIFSGFSFGFGLTAPVMKRILRFREMELELKYRTEYILGLIDKAKDPKNKQQTIQPEEIIGILTEVRSWVALALKTPPFAASLGAVPSCDPRRIYEMMLPYLNWEYGHGRNPRPEAIEILQGLRILTHENEIKQSLDDWIEKTKSRKTQRLKAIDSEIEKIKSVFSAQDPQIRQMIRLITRLEKAYADLSLSPQELAEKVVPLARLYLDHEVLPAGNQWKFLIWPYQYLSPETQEAKTLRMFLEKMIGLEKVRSALDLKGEQDADAIRDSADHALKHLAKKDPEMVSLIANSENAKIFLPFLSRLRMGFYDYKLGTWEFKRPLKTAIELKLYFEIKPGLYVSPITDSFRRFILFRAHSKEGVLEVNHAVEIKIPGDEKLIVSERNFEYADLLYQAYPANTAVKPIGFIRYEKGDFEMYGKKVTAEKTNPVSAAIFEYQGFDQRDYDGRRVTNFESEAYKEIAALYPSRYRDDHAVREKIVQRAVLFLAKAHEIGILGQGVPGALDLHLENFRIVLGEDDFTIYNAGDYEAFLDMASSLNDEYHIREDLKAFFAEDGWAWGLNAFSPYSFEGKFDKLNEMYRDARARVKRLGGLLPETALAARSEARAYLEREESHSRVNFQNGMSFIRAAGFAVYFGGINLLTLMAAHYFTFVWSGFIYKIYPSFTTVSPWLLTLLTASFSLNLIISFSYWLFILFVHQSWGHLIGWTPEKYEKEKNAIFNEVTRIANMRQDSILSGLQGLNPDEPIQVIPAESADLVVKNGKDYFHRTIRVTPEMILFSQALRYLLVRRAGLGFPYDEVIEEVAETIPEGPKRKLFLTIARGFWDDYADFELLQRSFTYGYAALIPYIFLTRLLVNLRNFGWWLIHFRETPEILANYFQLVRIFILKTDHYQTVKIRDFEKSRSEVRSDKSVKFYSNKNRVRGEYYGWEFFKLEERTFPALAASLREAIKNLGYDQSPNHKIEIEEFTELDGKDQPGVRVVVTPTYDWEAERLHGQKRFLVMGPTEYVFSDPSNTREILTTLEVIVMMTAPHAGPIVLQANDQGGTVQINDKIISVDQSPETVSREIAEALFGYIDGAIQLPVRIPGWSSRISDEIERILAEKKIKVIRPARSEARVLTAYEEKIFRKFIIIASNVLVVASAVWLVDWLLSFQGWQRILFSALNFLIAQQVLSYGIVGLLGCLNQAAGHRALLIYPDPERLSEIILKTKKLKILRNDLLESESLQEAYRNLVVHKFLPASAPFDPRAFLWFIKDLWGILSPDIFDGYKKSEIAEKYGFEGREITIGDQTFHVIGVVHGFSWAPFNAGKIRGLVKNLEANNIPLLSEQEFRKHYKYQYGEESDDHLWQTLESEAATFHVMYTLPFFLLTALLFKRKSIEQLYEEAGSSFFEMDWEPDFSSDDTFSRGHYMALSAYEMAEDSSAKTAVVLVGRGHLPNAVGALRKLARDKSRSELRMNSLLSKDLFRETTGYGLLGISRHSAAAAISPKTEWILESVGDLLGTRVSLLIFKAFSDYEKFMTNRFKLPFVPMAYYDPDFAPYSSRVITTSYFAMPDLMLHEIIHVLQGFAKEPPQDLLSESIRVLQRAGAEGAEALNHLMQWSEDISSNPAYSDGNWVDEFPTYLYQHLFLNENPQRELPPPHDVKQYYSSFISGAEINMNFNDSMRDFVDSVSRMPNFKLKRNLVRMWRIYYRSLDKSLPLPAFLIDETRFGDFSLYVKKLENAPNFSRVDLLLPNSARSETRNSAKPEIARKKFFVRVLERMGVRLIRATPLVERAPEMKMYKRFGKKKALRLVIENAKLKQRIFGGLLAVGAVMTAVSLLLWNIGWIQDFKSERLGISGMIAFLSLGGLMLHAYHRLKAEIILLKLDQKLSKSRSEIRNEIKEDEKKWPKLNPYQTPLSDLAKPPQIFEKNLRDFEVSLWGWGAVLMGVCFISDGLFDAAKLKGVFFIRLHIGVSILGFAGFAMLFTAAVIHTYFENSQEPPAQHDENSDQKSRSEIRTQESDLNNSPNKNDYFDLENYRRLFPKENQANAAKELPVPKTKGFDWKAILTAVSTFILGALVSIPFIMQPESAMNHVGLYVLSPIIVWTGVLFIWHEILFDQDIPGFKIKLKEFFILKIILSALIYIGSHWIDRSSETPLETRFNHSLVREDYLSGIGRFLRGRRFDRDKEIFVIEERKYRANLIEELDSKLARLKKKADHLADEYFDAYEPAASGGESKLTRIEKQYEVLDQEIRRLEQLRKHWLQILASSASARSELRTTVFSGTDFLKQAPSIAEKPGLGRIVDLSAVLRAEKTLPPDLQEELADRIHILDRKAFKGVSAHKKRDWPVIFNNDIYRQLLAVDDAGEIQGLLLSSDYKNPMNGQYPHLIKLASFENKKGWGGFLLDVYFYELSKQNIQFVQWDSASSAVEFYKKYLASRSIFRDLHNRTFKVLGRYLAHAVFPSDINYSNSSQNPTVLTPIVEPEVSRSAPGPAEPKARGEIRANKKYWQGIYEMLKSGEAIYFAGGAFAHVFRHPDLGLQLIKAKRGPKAQIASNPRRIPHHTYKEEQAIYRELRKLNFAPETKFGGSIRLGDIHIKTQGYRREKRWEADQKFPGEILNLEVQEQGIVVSHLIDNDILALGDVVLQDFGNFVREMWRAGYLDLDLGLRNYLARVDGQGHPISKDGHYTIQVHDFDEIFKIPESENEIFEFLNEQNPGTYMSNGFLLMRSLLQAHWGIFHKLLFPNVDFESPLDLYHRIVMADLKIPDADQAEYLAFLRALAKQIAAYRPQSSRSEVRTPNPQEILEPQAILDAQAKEFIARRGEAAVLTGDSQFFAKKFLLQLKRTFPPPVYEKLISVLKMIYADASFEAEERMAIANRAQYRLLVYAAHLAGGKSATKTEDEIVPEKTTGSVFELSRRTFIEFASMIGKAALSGGGSLLGDAAARWVNAEAQAQQWMNVKMELLVEAFVHGFMVTDNPLLLLNPKRKFGKNPSEIQLDMYWYLDEFLLLTPAKRKLLDHLLVDSAQDVEREARIFFKSHARALASVWQENFKGYTTHGMLPLNRDENRSMLLSGNYSPDDEFLAHVIVSEMDHWKSDYLPPIASSIIHPRPDREWLKDFKQRIRSFDRKAATFKPFLKDLPDDLAEKIAKALPELPADWITQYRQHKLVRPFRAGDVIERKIREEQEQVKQEMNTLRSKAEMIERKLWSPEDFIPVSAKEREIYEQWVREENEVNQLETASGILRGQVDITSREDYVPNKINKVIFSHAAVSRVQSKMNARSEIRTGYIDLIGNQAVVPTRMDEVIPARVLLRDMASLFHLESRKKILTIGATAEEINLLLKGAPEAQIMNVDIDAGRLTEIGKLFNSQPEFSNRLQLYRADAGNLPEAYFADGAYDFIYAGALNESAFKNIDSAVLMLQKIADEEDRLLAPGGYLLHFAQYGDQYHLDAIADGTLRKIPNTIGFYQKAARSEVRAKRSSRKAFGNREGFMKAVDEALAQGVPVSRIEFAKRMGYDDPDALNVMLKHYGVTRAELEAKGVTFLRSLKGESKKDKKKRIEDKLRAAVEKAEKEVGREDAAKLRAKVIEIMGYQYAMNFMSRMRGLGIDIEAEPYRLQRPESTPPPFQLTPERQWLKETIESDLSQEEKERWVQSVLQLFDAESISSAAAYTLIEAVRSGKTDFHDLDKKAAKDLGIDAGTVHSSLIGTPLSESARRTPHVMQSLTEAANRKISFERQRAEIDKKSVSDMELIAEKFRFPFYVETLAHHPGLARRASDLFEKALENSEETFTGREARILKAVFRGKNYAEISSNLRHAFTTQEVKGLLFGSGESKGPGLYRRLEERIMRNDILKKEFESIIHEAGLERNEFPKGFFQWLQTKNVLSISERNWIVKLMVYGAENFPPLETTEGKLVPLPDRLKVLAAYLDGKTLPEIAGKFYEILGNTGYKPTSMTAQKLQHWFSGRKPEIQPRTGAIDKLKHLFEETAPAASDFRFAAGRILDPKTPVREIQQYLESIEIRRTPTLTFLKTLLLMADPGHSELRSAISSAILQTMKDPQMKLDSNAISQIFIRYLSGELQNQPLLEEFFGLLLQASFNLRRKSRREDAAKLILRLTHAFTGPLNSEDLLLKALARVTRNRPENLHWQRIYNRIIEAVFKPFSILSDHKMRIGRYHRRFAIPESQKFNIEKIRSLSDDHTRRLFQQDAWVKAYFGTGSQPAVWPVEKMMLFAVKNFPFMIKSIPSASGKEYSMNPAGMEWEEVMDAIHQSLQETAYRYDSPYFPLYWAPIRDSGERARVISAVEADQTAVRAEIESLKQEIRSASAEDKTRGMSNAARRLQAREEQLKFLDLLGRAHRAYEKGEEEWADSLFKKIRLQGTRLDRQRFNTVFVTYMARRLKTRFAKHRADRAKFERKMLSLEKPLGEESESSVGAQLADTEQETALEQLLRQDSKVRDQFRQIMQLHLNERNRMMLELYLGMDPSYDGLELGYDDIAQILAFRGMDSLGPFKVMGRQNVQQTIDRMLRKLTPRLMKMSQQQEIKQWDDFISQLWSKRTIEPENIDVFVSKTGEVQIGKYFTIKGLEAYKEQTLKAGIADYYYDESVFRAPRRSLMETARSNTSGVYEVILNLRKEGKLQAVYHFKFTRDAQGDSQLNQSHKVYDVSDSEFTPKEKPRSEIRTVVKDSREIPAAIFIEFQELTGPARRDLRKYWAALANRTRGSKLRLVIYGADPKNPEYLKIKENFVGFKNASFVSGDFSRAMKDFGVKTADRNVRVSFDAVSLKEQLPDQRVKLFYLQKDSDLWAAYLLVVSGSEQGFPGLSNAKGYYEVTGEFLREQIQSYQAGLIVKMAA